ncbi:Transcription initiation factor IIB [Phytophthora boehmeriae]|uniref:General transcription factor TFIIB n=1 Tax=Phytophthora boehmeriae TaxID=109152 RepID=A0A8T1X3Y1_9STRA|nr:Transcription initiation factor IIB [Phytophthora boehmeriae]
MGGECVPDHCRDCGSADVVTDFSAGDVVCRSCGMILGERIIDDTPEWRTFANDDRGGDPAAKSRVGDTTDARLDSLSLSTFLVDPVKGKSSGGGEAGVGQKHKRPNISSESAKVKRMQRNMQRIQEVADYLSLPKNIVEIALDVYAEAEKKGVNIRGPERESMAVAVLFVACRKSGNARSLKEFEDASGIAKRRIGKSFMSLSRRLDIEMTQPSTEEYVRRFCSRLGLPNKTQTIAHDVAKKADTLGLSNGQPPVAVAASVIYLVAAYTNAKRSIQEISDVTMIGEKSMKRVCKELNKSRVVLFEGVVMT